MPSKLGFNWLAYHKEENDFNIFQRWQPKSIKLYQDHWRDPFLIERLYAMLPDTVFVFRDHPLSEQKGAMEADPETTGKLHAGYWHGVYGSLLGKVKTFDLNRTVFLGINEPDVGDDKARGIVTAYTVAFLDQLTGYGLCGGALNLSVGWPDNSGPDAPVNWTPFGPVKDAIQRGGHYLMLHEYWSPAGPAHNFGWWAGRLGQCPWNVRIIVGECGIDHGVIDRNLTGWQSYKSKEEYMAQLVEYDRLMRRDPRVHSLQIFSYDFTDRWWSFDVRPLQQELAAYAESERGKVDATISFPYYPPNVVLETESDMLATILKTAFGDKFHDERRRDFATTDSRDMRYLVIHHSATARETTTQAIRDHHTKTNGWSGIGYHFVLRLGHLYYVGDVDTQRAHILNRNNEGLGVCITGTYTANAPAKEDIDAARLLVKCLDGYYGHKKELTGHRTLMAPNYTTCPGDRLAALIPTLRLAAPLPVPEPPPAPKYVIGPGVQIRMDKLGDTPRSNELYMEHGSMTIGAKYVYYWIKSTGDIVAVERVAA